jgi:hypothetical protein
MWLLFTVSFLTLLEKEKSIHNPVAHNLTFSLAVHICALITILASRIFVDSLFGCPSYFPAD